MQAHHIALLGEHFTEVREPGVKLGGVVVEETRCSARTECSPCTFQQNKG
jgi:hypothetical protein